MVGCAMGWHLGDAILWIQVAFKDSPRYEARRFAKSNNLTGAVIILPDMSGTTLVGRINKILLD